MNNNQQDSRIQLSCDLLLSDNKSSSYRVTDNEIAEGRKLYLESLKYSNYIDIIKKTIVNPLMLKYNEPNSSDVLINVKLIPKNNINYCYIRHITTNIFTIGRASNCNITIDDMDVSRIHLIGMIIKNKIIIVDTWSLHGTSIYDKKNHKETILNHRQLLKCSADKRCILELKNYLVVINSDKIINDRYCLVCMEAPRIIRNSCGHGVLCQDCNLKLRKYNEDFKCPICKDLMRHAYISNCNNTYYSNTY